MSPSSEFQKASAAFRQHLPDLNTPRFQTAKTQDPYEYADFFRTNHAPPWLFNLTETWKELHEEPFVGVTSDGSVQLLHYSGNTSDIPQAKRSQTSTLQKKNPSQ